MQWQINKTVGLLSLLLVESAIAQSPGVSNHSPTLTGFEPVSKFDILCVVIPNCLTVRRPHLRQFISCFALRIFTTLLNLRRRLLDQRYAKNPILLRRPKYCYRSLPSGHCS